MIDYECNFCGSVFEKRTDRGACPCCGGPNPSRQLGNPILWQGLYLEGVNKNAETYYTPIEPDLKSRIFKTFGFKLTLIVGLVALAAMIYLFTLAFKVGEQSSLSNEQLLKIPPTIEAIQPAIEIEDEWFESNFRNWLDPSEALKLREMSNVTNLVVLGVDEVKISTDKTLELDESLWEQKKPYFLEAMTIKGTEVKVRIDQNTYYLNMYQPFIWSGAENQVSMVNSEGFVYTLKNVKQAKVLDVTEVNPPIEINPNTQLVIPFTKQK